jgi:murein DD-endopeptidase MepM/ murein hydrolase activator NlpD
MISRNILIASLAVAFSGMLVSLEGRGGTLSPCGECESLDGFVPPDEIDDEIRRMVGKYKGGAGKKNVAIQKARGVIETHLYPEFINGADCPEIDSEKWAIDYSHKRNKKALHKGIDIPQPRGKPIRAIAEGVVVGRFLNDGNRKGIEIMLRHTPGQTGLPYWTYSQYTHLQEMPPLPVGTKVRIGDEIGKTSNTGKMGKRVRRDALHFAILFSTYPEWSNDRAVVTPKDGHFMDPNAFYRLEPPYDSPSLSSLPDEHKSVPIPYMSNNGSFVPPNTKRIWPYPCD